MMFHNASVDGPSFIFLWGFMASGKSYEGKQLGAQLHLPWIDLDAIIEGEMQTSIAAIIASEGEKAFRKYEQKALHSLLTLAPNTYIISCGGGTPCFFDNAAWMRKHGTTLLLDTDLETLKKRVCTKLPLRPLVDGLSEDACFAFVEKTWHARRDYYVHADHIFTGEDIQTPQLVQSVRAILFGKQ